MCLGEKVLSVLWVSGGYSFAKLTVHVMLLLQSCRFSWFPGMGLACPDVVPCVNLVWVRLIYALYDSCCFQGAFMRTVKEARS